MNSFKRFIMNICLFFSIYKEHPMKSENELENKQQKRGEIILIIKEKNKEINNMLFDPIKAMEKNSEQRQAEIEEENRILRNCERQYITKYVFPDTTETFNKDEAMLYSDKYFERIYDIQKRFIDYVYDDKNKIEGDNQYTRYDKDIINNFKKEYYKLLWELFFERFGSSEYDRYFEKFADNPENDMEGAARCVNNIPFEWISFIELGRELISCDNNGRKFSSFRSKTDYIEEEYYSQQEK